MIIDRRLLRISFSLSLDLRFWQANSEKYSNLVFMYLFKLVTQSPMKPVCQFARCSAPQVAEFNMNHPNMHMNDSICTISGNNLPQCCWSIRVDRDLCTGRTT